MLNLSNDIYKEYTFKCVSNERNRMPKFLDVHPMKGFDEETLRKWTLPAPVDEFGVKPENMFYNKEEDRFFCLLHAPNKEAIEKHHARFGLKCEWITEVVTTA